MAQLNPQEVVELIELSQVQGQRLAQFEKAQMDKQAADKQLAGQIDKTTQALLKKDLILPDQVELTKQALANPALALEWLEKVASRVKEASLGSPSGIPAGGNVSQELPYICGSRGNGHRASDLALYNALNLAPPAAG